MSGVTYMYQLRENILVIIHDVIGKTVDSVQEGFPTNDKRS